jgi:hypothetical protein
VSASDALLGQICRDSYSIGEILDMGLMAFANVRGDPLKFCILAVEHWDYLHYYCVLLNKI